jgi:hypothetical protein
MAPAPRTFMDSVERFLLRVVLLGVVLLALLLAFAAWHTRHNAPAAGLAGPPAAPATTGITLTIDYGDGTQKRFTDLSFTPGMTVLDAMNAARSHARPLVFTSTGAGEGAIVSAIDGVGNEGGTPGGLGGTLRNWQFWVNDRYGEASIGVAKLAAGDRVTWGFRKYEPGAPAPR